MREVSRGGGCGPRGGPGRGWEVATAEAAVAVADKALVVAAAELGGVANALGAADLGLKDDASARRMTA